MGRISEIYEVNPLTFPTPIGTMRIIGLALKMVKFGCSAVYMAWLPTEVRNKVFSRSKSPRILSNFPL